MKISKAFEEYIDEEIIGAGGSINTCEAYRYAMKAFISEWGNLDVERIEAIQIKRFSVSFLKNAQTKQQRHSSGTVRNYVSCLKAVLRMCEANGLNVIDSSKIKLPRREKHIPFCLEEYEVEELINAAQQPVRGYPAVNRFRNVLIIKMLYCTGLRVSELCKLNIGDIHNRQFTVIGKSKDPRICFITEEVETLIKEYLKMRNDCNPALFVSSQTGGQRISPKTVQLMFRRIRSQLAVGKATPHTLRHSFCTKLLDRNVDIRYTATLMGHQDWNTTKIYTTISNNSLKTIYDNAIS